MKKVVINSDYGGFGISPEAALWLYKKGFKEKDFITPVDEYWNPAEEERYADSKHFGKANSLKEWRNYLAGKTEGSLFITVFSPCEKFVINTRPNNREHPLLVKCVETMKDKANGYCSKLKVVKIPSKVKYDIHEYDGRESIHEVHRSWS